MIEELYVKQVLLSWTTNLWNLIYVSVSKSPAVKPRVTVRCNKRISK